LFFEEVFCLGFRILDSQWYKMNATYFVFPEVLENTKNRIIELFETEFETIDDILKFNKLKKV